MNESCRVENLAVQNRSDPDECNESHNCIKLFIELDSKVWNFGEHFSFFLVHITTKILKNFDTFSLSNAKGQLISKCLVRVIVSTKISTKIIVRISALDLFLPSWELPGNFLGLPGDLVSNIMNKELQKVSRNPTGRHIKFQGRNPEIISLVFWK